MSSEYPFFVLMFIFIAQQTYFVFVFERYSFKIYFVNNQIKKNQSFLSIISLNDA